MGQRSRDANSRSLRSLLRWAWPFLRPSRARLTVAAILGAGMLAAQALIPLAVEQILSVDTWEAGPVVVLALLIGVLVACGYMLEREAHTIASRVGHLMRRTIFAHVVRSRVLHQEG
ncbi:MAG: hypothetical protein ACKOMX_03395, partial [Actinomycetota bacterium]